MKLTDYIYYEESAGTIYGWDALKILRLMESESVQCCVTSPPYWGLRDYGVDGQLGIEKTPEEYVEKLRVIFAEVRRVLRSDGTLWLVIGDSYAGGGRGCNTPKQQSNRGSRNMPDSKVPDGLKSKDICGIPWRVAFALQSDGWWLRQDIIWSKPNPMPESVTDRCTKSHEYVFHLSKSARYYYDAEAIKEESVTSPNDKSHHTFGMPGGKVDSTPMRKKESGKRWKASDKKRGEFNGKHGDNAFRAVREFRNKRSVWTVATQPYPEAHFAVYPQKLIEPCILAGSPKGGVVLDPFLGSGTTAFVAKKLNRRYVGIELKPEYLKLAKQRLAQEVLEL